MCHRRRRHFGFKTRAASVVHYTTHSMSCVCTTRTAHTVNIDGQLIFVERVRARSPACVRVCVWGRWTDALPVLFSFLRVFTRASTRCRYKTWFRQFFNRGRAQRTWDGAPCRTIFLTSLECTVFSIFIRSDFEWRAVNSFCFPVFFCSDKH